MIDKMYWAYYFIIRDISSTFRLDQCTMALMCIERVHPIEFAINVDH